MIQVTQPYLPSERKFQKYLSGIYERKWLTNFGPLHKELTDRLEDYLGVQNLLLVANGTLALQLAFKALKINNSAITTPFTFVATSSAMQWMNIDPFYVDINANTFNLSPQALAAQINNCPGCSGVVPVHVFGNPCQVEEIEGIAIKNKLPVVYDAAHAFGIRHKGESLLSHGDASVLSFHATKVFHTVEGGAIIFKSKDAYHQAERMINFGIEHVTGDIIDNGINAKMSEIHAAMGLCVLDDIDEIIEKRNAIVAHYKLRLDSVVEFQQISEDTSLNGAYMPVVFRDKGERDNVHDFLLSSGVATRKYFSPSLDTISHFNDGENQPAITSRVLSDKILCLPVYTGLGIEDVDKISNAIKGLVCA